MQRAKKRILLSFPVATAAEHIVADPTYAFSRRGSEFRKNFLKANRTGQKKSKTF